MFPEDDSVADASNYCRNPDLRDSGLWCVTSAGQEPCQVEQLCNEGKGSAAYSNGDLHRVVMRLECTEILHLYTPWSLFALR